MKQVLLVKYGEIALRGKNRYLIENQLIKTIIKNLKSIGNYYVYKEQGRFVVENCNENDDFNMDEVVNSVVNILGVTAVCPAFLLKNNSIEDIRKCMLSYVKQHYTENMTFKVETKRADKKYPLNSKDISADVGGYILNNSKNTTVDVHNPDVVLMVEVRNFVYIYSKVIKGFGGLPMGMSGKATLLLSGGIDSPVAGFLTAKRGVEIDAVYFHSPPYTSDRAKQKVIDLAKQIAKYTGKINLYIVSFTDVQLRIYDCVPTEKITIFIKRSMMRIAEKIAIKNGSLALINGDSIGQVASQTMHAINAIDSVISELTILRPLCSMDKQEIIDIAKKIGTFDISIQPFEDCCTVFVPKHPETKPKKSIIENIEKNIVELDELTELAIKNTELVEL